MRIVTWTNNGGRGVRTHALVGEATTWYGRLVPHGARLVTYTVDVPLPFDCQHCVQAWLARPRKTNRPA